MELKIPRSTIARAIKNENMDNGDFDFYVDTSEELKRKGIYYLVGEIESGSLIQTHQDIILKHLDPNWHGEIQLIVNSCGGESSEMWALIDLLDWVRMDVRTIGMGLCASAGAMLLAAGTPGKRIAAKNLTVMIHQGWTVVEGKHDELIAQTKYVTDEQKRDIRFWIEKSRYKSPETVQKYLLHSTDNYFTAKEALRHGIIDEVIGLPKEDIVKPKAKKRTT
jgi:ATP-dependent Clp protease protease subunit